MDKAMDGGEAADRAPPAKDQKERAGVQSLERAFAILEQIAQSREGIGLAELSKRVGLHNSTTFHLVKTMVALGYIRQSRETKRYRIGRPLFALAAGSLDEVELVSLATPILENLSATTGESGHFAVRSSDAVVVIAKTSGTGAFQLTERAGVTRPAHCTALGKVLLAALTPAQLDRFLASHELRAFTPKSITEPEPLRRELAEVARTGIAFDDGEFDPEVRCVAVPSTTSPARSRARSACPGRSGGCRSRCCRPGRSRSGQRRAGCPPSSAIARPSRPPPLSASLPMTAGSSVRRPHSRARGGSDGPPILGCPLTSCPAASRARAAPWRPGGVTFVPKMRRAVARMLHLGGADAPCCDAVRERAGNANVD